MTRESKAKNLNDHIKTLGTAEADTTVTYADLTGQTIRIKSMHDSNDEQMDQIRTLNSRGVAGVADRLATALQAVNAAAINQAAGLARDSMSEMADKTNALSQKEVIRTAMGLGDKASDIQKAIEGLAQYGDVLKTSTTITRDSLKEIREQLAAAEQTAADVQKDIRESQGVYAEEGNAPVGDAKAAPAKKSGLDLGNFKV
jgi:ABC-type transporter Mla subunit MlaD